MQPCGPSDVVCVLCVRLCVLCRHCHNGTGGRAGFVHHKCLHLPELDDLPLTGAPLPVDGHRLQLVAVGYLAARS